MILVTRLNGPPVALNCDLIERAEATPDTVLTLIDGTKYVVEESIEQVVDAVRDYRASVVARAHELQTATNADTDADANATRLRLVHEAEEDSWTR